MSLDIILTRECAPRETYGDGDLIAISHALSFQEEIHGATAEEAQCGAPPDDDLKLDDGEATITLGEVRERLRKAWPRLAECMGCPLNVTGRAVGCHARVDYPIDAATERAVARAATEVCGEDAPTAEAILARTPVATPAFREAGRGVFEGAFAPYVKVPWEGTEKGVSLDAFWDLLFEPRRPEDGLAVARILSLLQRDTPTDDPATPEAQRQLSVLGFVMRVFAASMGDAGYAVSA